MHNIAQDTITDTDVVTPLEQMTSALEQDMKDVNALIIKHMHSGVPMIPKLATYLIASGGKRVRPLLTIASAKLLGYKGDAHYKLAASVEFIHTATLLHDDVVDDSDQRRGKSSAHTIFGNEAAVLVGDFLFSRAFQLMVQIGSLDTLEVLSNASAIIAEGEVLQLSNNNNINITEEQYLDVIRAKTAELFAAACEAGGLVANCSPEQRNALREYGENLGIAFQMIDDLLDYHTPDDALGKNTGDDFQEGKMTLPVILALTEADADEMTFWTRTFSRGQQRNDDDFKTACGIINNHRVFDKGIEKAKIYGAKAQTALSVFDDKEPLKKMMYDLIDFVIERRY